MPSWRNPAPASSASSSKPFSPVIPPPLAHRRATRGLASRPLPSAPAFSIQHLPLSCERGSLVPLRGVREPNPRTGERKMKSEQIKEITDKATEQLVDALNAGHSETLTGYLKAIGRFHRYSLHNVLLIASQKPAASYVAGFHTCLLRAYGPRNLMKMVSSKDGNGS